MKFLTQILMGTLLLTTVCHAESSSSNDHVIELSCPNSINGTLHMNNTWNGGYLTVAGVGILPLKSYEPIDNEGTFYIFSNGKVEVKILPWVRNKVARFYLWQKEDWRLCDWE